MPADAGEAAQLDYRRGYYNEPGPRAALNALVRETFDGLDFSPWNALGIDFAEYTPFSYFDGERAVANVSASPMELVVGGESIAAVQIGTVATAPAWRGRGLATELLGRAHEYWEPRRSLFFLFAHPGAAGFYERLGYRRGREVQFDGPAPPFVPALRPARRLDLGHRADVALLRRLADERASVSFRFGVVRQAWLLLFHAAVAYPRQVSYIDILDAAAITERRGATLRLIDVIGREMPTLAQIYPYLGAAEIERIEYLFSPDRLAARGVVGTDDPASELYIRGPLAAEHEAFRVPATAYA